MKREKTFYVTEKEYQKLSRKDKERAIVRYTRYEVVAVLEKGARKRLGIGARQMFEGYVKGKIDCCEIADLRIFSSLLPDDDPLFQGLKYRP